MATTFPFEKDIFEEPTKRELDVLELVAQGLRDKEVASQLYITVSTVIAHMRNIRKKLLVPNRMQAVIKAHQIGWLPRHR